MPAGLTLTVAERLWLLTENIAKNGSKKFLLEQLNYTERALSADIHKLNNLGFNVKFSRKQQRYFISLPPETINLKLSLKEFFLIYYTLQSAEGESDSKDLKDKLELLLNEETEPVYDCGPAYGITQNITDSLTDIFNKFREAIVKKRKTVFFYRSISSEPEIRIVHPYKLIHTPVSWYLAGYCEERKDFRNFKLARISQLKLLSDKFTPKNFDLREYLGDAWWLQWDKSRINNPYQIQVLFTGEAAQTICEYKFHPSQQFEITEAGTLVNWKLSYLEEFATWLMQWIGSIKIIRPDELKQIINNRIKNYK